MKLTTKTVYDYPHMLDLQRVAGKSFAKKQMTKKRITAFLLGVAFLAMDVMLIVRGGTVTLWTLLFAVPGVLMLGWGIFFYPVTARTTCKAMGKEVQHNEFEFEDEMVVAWRGSESSEYLYEDCTQLIETELCYYMMLNGGGGLILDKANVEGGTHTDLIRFLEEKTGKTTTWMGNH